MKKYILSIILLFISLSVPAQSRLSVQNLTVEQFGGQVEVSFDATASSGTSGINNTYVFTPLLYKEGNLRRLSPLVFGSRRAEILHRRRGAPAGKLHRKGATVRYHCILPYESWMTNGRLALEESVRGCCRTDTSAPLLLADCVLPQAPSVVVPPPAIVPSIGRQMDEKYTFVAPSSELGDMPDLTDARQQQAIGQELPQEEGALRIYFEVARAVIDPAFDTNAGALKELAEAVNAIGNSTDSRITHIIIGGFASPEGTLDFNERLAGNRALALKEFLTANTTVETDRIHLYNGGENWTGLRRLVAGGDMPGKEEVLRIIDRVPVARGREKQLMHLNGGIPYRYMMEHYFPQLRHAAHIRVYYTEVPDKQNISEIK